MKYKFKVRICYHSYDYYIIQYAYYKIWPTWNTLSWWFEQSVTSNTQTWSPRLLKIDKAEDLATRIKTIEDVKKWYENDKKKEIDFYKRRKEYYDKNVRYKTRYM